MRAQRLVPVRKSPWSKPNSAFGHRHLRARASSRLLRKSYQDRLQGLQESLVAQSTSRLAAQSDAAAAVQQSLQAELASAAESGAASEARAGRSTTF